LRGVVYLIKGEGTQIVSVKNRHHRHPGRSSRRSGSGKMGWWGGTMHKWDKEAKWSIGGAARAAAAADADYPEIEAGHVDLLRH
jgi:hypothetical protein